MFDQTILWSILTVSFTVLQLLGTVVCVFWLKSRYRREQRSPPPPESSSQLASFYYSSKKSASLPSFKPRIKTLNLQEDFPSAESLSLLREKGVDRASKGEDLLVLPIYCVYLQIHIVHCFLWVALTIFVIAKGSNLVEWGESDKSKVDVSFVVGTSILLGAHAALFDGVQFFLSQPSIGTAAVREALAFGVLWACVNAMTLGLISWQGGIREDYVKLRFNQLPLWDPFFIRIAIMLLFNLVLTAQRLFAERYKTKKENTKNSKINVTEKRTSWVRLAVFNLGFTVIIFGIYMFDFFGESEGNFWATMVASAYLIFIGAYTPLLYLTLLDDSRYWRRVWGGELAELGEASLLDFSAFSFDKVLGSGGFATVWRGRVWGEVPIAVKVLHVRELNAEIIESFIDEVKILSVLQHPNVVQFVGACLNPPDLLFAMELCLPETLAQKIRKFAREKRGEGVLFTEREIGNMGTQLASALGFLHTHVGLLHLDVKSSNVLFSPEDGRCKLADFGLSVWMANQDGTSRCCGTPGYIAPEILRFSPPQPSADIFSVGIVLYEMVRGRLAWRTAEGHMQIDVVELQDLMASRQLRPSLRKLICVENPSEIDRSRDGVRYVSQGLLDTVVACWDEAAERRPDCETLIRMLGKLI